jgi:hypothetical protein
MKRVITIIAIICFYVWPLILWGVSYVQLESINWTLPLIFIMILIHLCCWVVATGIWYYISLQKPKKRVVRNGRDTTQNPLDYVIIFLIMGLCISSCNNEPPIEIVSCGRDYQIDVLMDTMYVYDEDRFVGKILINWKSSLDSLLMEDNL